MMNENSLHSTNHSKVSDEVRQLIIDYCTAYNNGEYALAEKLLHDLKQVRPVS